MVWVSATATMKKTGLSLLLLVLLCHLDAAAEPVSQKKQKEQNQNKRLLSSSSKHPQYGFAHRVNSLDTIRSTLGKGIIGIECDIIWSSSRSAWVVQHDTPNLSHAGPTLTDWLETLAGYLEENFGSLLDSFSVLWLDIKSPDDDDVSTGVMDPVRTILNGSEFNKVIDVIYDMSDKNQVLQNRPGYARLKSKGLDTNEGIGLWLENGDEYHVPALIEKMEEDGITRSIVSHGHAFDISENTLSTINLLNDAACDDITRRNYCFKKVFTWTNALQSSMEDYIDPSHSYATDGQIIGSPIKEWETWYADDDIPDFVDAVDEFSSSERLATVDDPFWEVPPRPFHYTVVVRTGDVTNGGTDSDVFLTIYGEDGRTTEEVRLNGLISGNAFEAGDVDSVNVYAIDVGTISKIKIRKDNAWAGPDWYLNSISIDDDAYAKFDQWIDDAAGGYTVDVTGPPKDYDLVIKTSTTSGAGTDSNIYIILYGTLPDGTQSETKEVRLNGYLSGNAFEAGDTDRLTLVGLKDVGDLTRIRLRNGGEWLGSDWRLSYITVNGETINAYTWINDGQSVTLNFPTPAPTPVLVPSCMAGDTGVYVLVEEDDEEHDRLRRPEVENNRPDTASVTSGDESDGLISPTSSSHQSILTKVKDLKVSDNIRGLDENLNPTVTCAVEAVGSFGFGPVYGNYTDGHYILNPQTGNVERHGYGTNSLDFSPTVTEKFIVVTSCPLGVDEAGIGFTPFDSDFFGELTQEMSWIDYLLLHKAILRIVRETGGFWFHGWSYSEDGMVFLQSHAPIMCTTMLRCMKNNDDCEDFENASILFIERALAGPARERALRAFRNIGHHRSLGSASGIISAGGSAR